MALQHAPRCERRPGGSARDPAPAELGGGARHPGQACAPRQPGRRLPEGVSIDAFRTTLRVAPPHTGWVATLLVGPVLLVGLWTAWVAGPSAMDLENAARLVAHEREVAEVIATQRPDDAHLNARATQALRAAEHHHAELVARNNTHLSRELGWLLVLVSGAASSLLTMSLLALPRRRELLVDAHGCTLDGQRLLNDSLSDVRVQDERLVLVHDHRVLRSPRLEAATLDDPAFHRAVALLRRRLEEPGRHTALRAAREEMEAQLRPLADHSQSASTGGPAPQARARLRRGAAERMAGGREGVDG